MNINVQNKAMLPKNLDKIYNIHDIPRVNLVFNTYYVDGRLPSDHMEGSFGWGANLKLIDCYRSMARRNMEYEELVFFLEGSTA